MEDDGTATGLHADQLNLAGLPALVAARASPSLAVQVEAIEINGVPVARLVVPKARSVVATNGGVYPRRRIKHDGKPECVPRACPAGERGSGDQQLWRTRGRRDRGQPAHHRAAPAQPQTGGRDEANRRGRAPMQHEQMVLNFERQHGQIRRAEVMELCRLSEGQAKDLLRRLRARGNLIQHGDRRAAFYSVGNAAGH